MKLNFMGDVMFAELLENLGSGLITSLERTAADPFDPVKPLLHDADFNVVNLECVFSDTSILEPPFDRILISPERYLRFLTANRINVVNTANNHALDHGREAFARSCDLVRDQGIAIIGYDRGVFFQEEPVVLTHGGRKLGLLGYNISNFPAEDREAMIERIVGVVREAGAANDTLVVSIHWGEEYTNIPPAYVVRYGRRILEAGCTIIHGHHSHQVQGVHGDGSRIFAPSLGNFIFDQKIRDNRPTAVLQVEVGEAGLSHRSVPCYLNDRFQPVPAPHLQAYLDELDTLLASCLEDDSECRFADRIAARVSAGHRSNRVRMRMRMLARFWNYLPHVRQIMEFRRSERKIYSVIDSLDSLPRN
ncbi:MAG: CapA family protein [bacterium]